MNVVLECEVQTLDPIVQQEIRRINNKEKMIEIMEELNCCGIKFEAHLIYGLPKQTIQSLKKDYGLLSNYTSEIRLFPLVLLKGTDLDISIESTNSTNFTFSPIFPREVISTK